MGVDITPIYYDWESLLDKHIVIVKSSLARNDFGAVDAFIVDEKMSRIDHTATFKHFIEPNHFDSELKHYPDKIKALNEKAVEKGRSAYGDFSSTVLNLQNTDADKPPWELDIDKSATRTKEAASGAIDEAVAKAKDIFKKLPKEARAQAANVFTSGLNVVLDFFSNVWSQIKAVTEAVYQFVLRTWDKIKLARNAVQSAAQTAIDWIKGTFSSSGKDADGPVASAGSLRAKEEHGNGATYVGGHSNAGGHSYVGKLTGN